MNGLLTACSTAEVKMQLLADETLHLTSAFQMAGFAHVIGSLRPADDLICVQVANFFYSSLVDSGGSKDPNRAVSEALIHVTTPGSNDSGSPTLFSAELPRLFYGWSRLE